MKRMKRSLAFLVSGALLITGAGMTAYGSEPASSAAAAGEVTIYATSDIHGTLEGSDEAIGIARVAGIAASAPGCLLVDAGDATQGSPFAAVNRGADVIRVMNAAGYDLMAVGNRDFDYGSDRLLENADLAEFPVLGANVIRRGELVLPFNSIVQAGGHSIGFIGITSTAAASSSSYFPVGGVVFDGVVKTVKDQIAHLRDKTDAIILLCHLGDDEASDSACEKMLNALSEDERAEVTAVIDGHGHAMKTDSYAFGGTSVPVIRTGTRLSGLGVLNVTFDGSGRARAQGRVMNRDEAVNYPLSSAGREAYDSTAAVLASVQAEQAAAFGQVICENEFPLWGGCIDGVNQEPCVVETSLGDLITDAFLAKGRAYIEGMSYRPAVIAAENGGAVFTTIPDGSLTLGDILNLFAGCETVNMIEITPAQLYTALEAGLAVSGQDDTGLLHTTGGSDNFLQAAGFTYSYDPCGAPGSRVTSVVLEDGKSLRRDDTSTKIWAAVNDHVASLGGFADGKWLFDLGSEDRIVEDYIRFRTEKGKKALSVPVTAGRIRIEGDRSPDTYIAAVPVESNEVPGTLMAGATLHLKVDGGEYAACTVDSDGLLRAELKKGPHTLCLRESVDGIPVYVNNYTGTGIAPAKEGSRVMSFLADSRPSEWALSRKTEPGRWREGPKWNWRFDLTDGTNVRGRWAYLEWRGSNDWYYFNQKGDMVTDWLEEDGNKYYLYPVHDGTAGYMYTGPREIGGVLYNFSTGGESPKGALVE